MSLTIQLLRPEDLLTLTIGTQNLKLDKSDPNKPILVVEDTSDPAYLIFAFPPQSITEKAYFETGNITSQPPFNQVPPGTPPLGTTDDHLLPAGQTPARISGPSRLVFQLPKTLTKIPYQTKSLLDWSQLTLVVSATAEGKLLPPPITAPTALQTSLELPYRLILSPGTGVSWVNAVQPVTHAGRTELWHTRLAKVITKTTKTGTTKTFQEASLAKPIPLRAIWSPDFVDHEPLPLHSLDETPFLAPLTPRDRAQIVILTSGTIGYYVLTGQNETSPFTPSPIQASRVFLSALGGWLSSRGSWSPLPTYSVPIDILPHPLASSSSARARRQRRSSFSSTPVAEPAIALPYQSVSLDLTEWNHLATEARDHYVKVVYEGYLYPFGHAASLVKVTERKFVPAELVPAASGEASSVTAYLKQHMYIVVREPEKSYEAAPYTHGGREMPFLSGIKINTIVTPDIDEPPQPGDPFYFSGNSFWINVGGGNFQFHLTATDLAGANIDFLAPLIFVSDSETDVGAVAPGVSDASSVQSNYLAAGNARVCDVRGKKIAYADPSAGDTILKTTGLLFDAQILFGPPFPSVPFIPVLSGADIVSPSLEELLGITTPVSVAFYPAYLQSGLDGNAGVFVEVSPAPPPVTFSANKSGGFATPGFVVTALSARKVIVAGSPDDAANGLIDPAAFFGGVTVAPSLFGTIPLPNLIPINSITGKAPACKTHPKSARSSSRTKKSRLRWLPRSNGNLSYKITLSTRLKLRSTAMARTPNCR